MSIEDNNKIQPDKVFKESTPGKYNYIRIINAVWQTMPFIDGYKGNHAVLFFALLDSINRNNWCRVALPLDYIINKVGFCRKVYTDSRNWLENQKIIEVIPGKNANQMAVFDLGLAVHIWTSTGTSADTGMDTSNHDLPVHKLTGTGTHYKTVNHIKPKTLNISFDTFWELYDNKKGKQESEKLWHKLTDEERQTAIDSIPKYKLATPDKTYRQAPKRYLKEKTFNDEITPAFKSDKKNHSAILIDKEYGQREKL